MPIDVDGIAVLAAMAHEPVLFSAVRSEASKIARTFVTKQLKDKSTTLQTVKSICQAIGADSFAIVLDNMSEADVRSLLAKMDAFHPGVVEGSAEWHRVHVLDLINGRTHPVEKSAGKRKGSRRAKGMKTPAKVGRAIDSRAMRARRKVTAQPA